jgi:hypothetical protein
MSSNAQRLRSISFAPPHYADHLDCIGQGELVISSEACVCCAIDFDFSVSSS